MEYFDSPDYQAFVRSCAAAPDDDLPRLVLADWLEERGLAHGELIRVQIQLKDAPPSVVEINAANGTVIGCCERHADNMGCDCLSLARPWESLRTRQVELVALMPDPLFKVLSRTSRRDADGNWSVRDNRPRFTAAWSRGFPERIRCPAADWLAHHETLRKRYVVRDVELRTTWFSTCYNPPEERHRPGGEPVNLSFDDHSGRLQIAGPECLAGLRSALVVVDSGDAPYRENPNPLTVGGCRVTVRYEEDSGRSPVERFFDYAWPLRSRRVVTGLGGHEYDVTTMSDLP